jgi:hypothetical protein
VETGQAVVGGERAGEDMGETRGLTSGSGLPAGERRERERGGAADGWGPALRRGRAKLGRLGRERERGERAREGGGSGLGRKTAQPREESFSFFYFYFLFLILIFYFYFFLSPFLLNNNLLNNLRC